MSDFADLPLFGGPPACEGSAPVKRRRKHYRTVTELSPPKAEPPAAGSAVLIAFPPSREVQLITDLACAFLDLRERHGRRCRTMLLTRRFKPIAARLRRMGVPAAAIERELAQLEAAVARSVWIADGRPRYGSGGGSAA